MATAGTNGVMWHNPASMYVGGSGLSVSGPDENGKIDWVISASSHKQYKSAHAAALWIAVGVNIDGTNYIDINSRARGIDMTTSQAVGTTIWSGSGYGSKTLSEGEHTIYGIISCYDYGATPTHCTFGREDVQITNKIKINVELSKPPKPPKNLRVWYEDGKIKCDWDDDIPEKCTFNYDNVNIYCNNVCIWSGNVTDSYKEIVWPMPFNTSYRFDVDTAANGKQDQNGNWYYEWGGRRSTSNTSNQPPAIPSGVVTIKETTAKKYRYDTTMKENERFVRDPVQVQGDIAQSVGTGYPSPTFELKVTIFDNASHSDVKTTSSKSLTRAVNPYLNLGSRDGNSLYAKAEGKMFYNEEVTYYENNNVVKKTEGRTVNLGSQQITIENYLTDYYVKIVKPGVNEWARGYVIQPGKSIKKIKYPKFKIR